MDTQNQAKGTHEGFKAFLIRTHAATIAVGIVLGLALMHLVEGIMGCFVRPLLAQIDLDGTGSFRIWVFHVGDFLGVLIHFVAVLFVLHLLSKVLLREEQKG